MNIAKENFIAYEQVRIKVQADMHDLKQVAAKASLPRSRRPRYYTKLQRLHGAVLS